MCVCKKFHLPRSSVSSPVTIKVKLRRIVGLRFLIVSLKNVSPVMEICMILNVTLKNVSPVIEIWMFLIVILKKC
jgi:hypothetical protein